MARDASVPEDFGILVGELESHGGLLGDPGCTDGASSQRGQQAGGSMPDRLVAPTAQSEVAVKPPTK